MRRYPPGSVRALLESDLISPATRVVMVNRISLKSVVIEGVFGADQYGTLQAICARLIPREGEERSIDIAAAICQRLAGGVTDGWRYDTMPPDIIAYRTGLDAIEELARRRHGASFSAIPPGMQDQILSDVQHGRVCTREWSGPPQSRFFEELLAECVEIFYSHPIASESIGYVGMADGRGWIRIGLNEREPWEPPAGSEEP